MQSAPIPADEKLRQRALDDLELLDTPAELYLDTLVRLTRELYRVETVLVSLVDRDRQWFKARIGLEASETPRDISFCGHAVAARSPLVVENALDDPRFADNPLVSGPPFIRFYAGQPLYSRDEQPIGTLCLIHSAPRQLSQEERLRLRDLGTLVEGYLHLRSVGQQARRLREAVNREQRKALIDPLTQLWNRAALERFYPREAAAAQDAGQRLGALYIDLDHFKQVNDQFGHAGGDQVLWQSARRMATALRPDDLLLRLGGEEFVALLAVHDAQELGLIAERVRRAIADEPMRIGERLHGITASLGTALGQPGESKASLLERADAALYQAKQLGRNRTQHAPDNT
ncbi:sensor domain-containing diguanylate cyclase [Pseudomonas sp. CAU 1711]|uniref:GGDEF domain-containing protein n=1 Tax=Pseudomonas sp. CAU 1711 TaxID=3140356 RepID=UPI00326167AA